MKIQLNGKKPKATRPNKKERAAAEAVLKLLHTYLVHEIEPHRIHGSNGRLHDLWEKLQAYWSLRGVTSDQVDTFELMKVCERAAREIESWPSWKKGDQIE